jgi:hypothetical protein
MIPTDATLAVLCVDSYRLTPAGEICDAGCDRAVVTRLPDCAVVAVRGSANARGWFTDFLILPRVLKSHPLLGDGEAGFVDGASALWAVLKPRLDPAVPLVIAGHSRGAGEAPWLAAEAIIDGFTVSRAVCFEAPWTAGAALAKGLGAVAGCQYVNGNDPVPHLPEVPWLVPAVWPVVRIGSPMADPLECHSISLIAAELAALEKVA